MNTPKKQRSYTWAALLFVFIMAAVPSILPSLLHTNAAPNNRITQQVTDERGLTSVMYLQDGEEWALDFLTVTELDSLKIVLSQ